MDAAAVDAIDDYGGLFHYIMTGENIMRHGSSSASGECKGINGRQSSLSQARLSM